MSVSKPLFVILDGYSMAYRHYHGTHKQELTAPDGSPTGAIYGFTRQILDIMLQEKPHYLAVAFDAGLSGRETIYPEYKAQRPDAPKDFEPQIIRIKQVLQGLNVPVLELDGYEADDIIGTMVTHAAAEQVHSRIVTGDGDLLQLINDDVDVLLMRPFGGPKLYGAPEFREKYELEPHQLIDLKALKGDSSDNIPGVRGMGEKTATPLIQQYGSLAGIYDHIDEIKPAVQKKLIEHKDAAFMSYDLARIRCDLPIALELALCVTKDYDPNAVMPLLDELGFKSLVGLLKRAAVHAQPVIDLDDGEPMQQMSLFGDDETAPSPQNLVMTSDFSTAVLAGELVHTHVVRTQEQLSQLVTLLESAAYIAFDTETTSTDPASADLVGISLSVDGENGYYIPVGHIDATDEQLPLEQVCKALRPALENPNIPKVAHNASYDMGVLGRYGIAVQPIGFDTMVAEWVRDSNSTELSLSKLALRSHLITPTGVLMQDIHALIGSGKKQITMAAVPIRKAAPYAAEDAAITFRLVEPLRTALAMQETGQAVFERLEMPLIPVICHMEQSGVLIDVAYLEQMSERLRAKLGEIEQQIYALSDGYGAFNINSPKQLNDVLFEKLNLPRQRIRKTTHGYSTAADVLEKLYETTNHPILEKILEHRELSKLKSTYVDALPQMINRYTGRVHTSFNQTGTSTGRLSSNSPNLQNIPIRTELGREVRHAFIAEEGMMLLSVDYSQVELRVMAHMADEPYLKDSFAKGEDIHAATAALVNGIALDEVTYEQRSFAKRVNFGLLYGMGAFRLSRDTVLTMAESEQFITTYFHHLPNVKRYIEDTKQMIRERGYVETLLGRRRYFGDVRNMNAQDLARAEREAINMPIQGTAADILKLAMIELYDVLKARKYKARLLLQVHDELVLEVAEDDVPEVARLVVDVMENAYILSPKLRANAQVGKNWRDMQPI